MHNFGFQVQPLAAVYYCEKPLFDIFVNKRETKSAEVSRMISAAAEVAIEQDAVVSQFCSFPHDIVRDFAHGSKKTRKGPGRILRIT
jgi:hypothetical protein